MNDHDKQLAIIVGAMVLLVFGLMLMADRNAQRAKLSQPTCCSKDMHVIGTGSSGDPLHLGWLRGDRVVVVNGEYAGRHGTVCMLPSDELARYYNLVSQDEVRVALDGGRGQTIAEGGRGGEAGVPINVRVADLRAE